MIIHMYDFTPFQCPPKIYQGTTVTLMIMCHVVSDGYGLWSGSEVQRNPSVWVRIRTPDREGARTSHPLIG